MVYGLDTYAPHVSEIIMSMDSSIPDIKDRLIDVFRREYGTFHNFNKEYYVTSKGDLHIMDTFFRVMMKSGNHR